MTDTKDHWENIYSENEPDDVSWYQDSPVVSLALIKATKMSGLPFKSAKELKEAQEDVRRSVWRRLEEAKVINEMIKREEFGFWTEEFREGLVCCYGEKKDNLVRVYSEGKGIKININKELADAAPSSEALLGVLVKSMSESFANTYYKAKGILPASEMVPDQDTLAKTARGKK